MYKKITITIALAVILSACQSNLSTPSSPTLSLKGDSQPTITTTPTPSTAAADINQLLNLKPNQKMLATLKTSLGDIKVQLFPDKAPKTVTNFVGLSEGTLDWADPKTGAKQTGKSLYAGTVFHRVIKDFMIQGGDPLGLGVGGPGYKFADEIDSSLSFDGPGYLAMANSGPNTNGSQFFITTVPTPWLNGKHTIFGKVISGQDIVKKIEAVKTDANDRPETPVTLQSVLIERQ